MKLAAKSRIEVPTLIPRIGCPAEQSTDLSQQLFDGGQPGPHARQLIERKSSVGSSRRDI